MNLEQLGWSDHFETDSQPHRKKGLIPGRVVRAGGGFYTLMTPAGEVTATLAGHLRHGASADTLPVVGDWVMVNPVGDEPARVQAVLQRTTALKRAAVGNRKGLSEKPGVPQVLASNVDIALLVTGLDNDYNPRRIERYLTLVYESGAVPVIVLNKADLCTDLADCRAEIEAIAFGTPVLVTSARTGEGLDALASHLSPGTTLVLLGSSGAGKSTLLNRLAGAEHQRTSEVSTAVGKGVHTTTHRELFPLPEGALVIDTPGLRELHLWGESEEGLGSTFPDIVTLAQHCRFSDCRHEDEPGCAIMEALDDDRLDPERLESYFKQRGELAFAARRHDLAAQLAQKQKRKSISREIKRWYRHHGDES